MDFDLYQDVILKVELADHGFCAGDVGTLVDVVPSKEVGYSVEFFDMTGKTVVVVTLPSSLFRAPTSADRPSSRHLAGASR